MSQRWWRAAFAIVIMLVSGYLGYQVGFNQGQLAGADDAQRAIQAGDEAYQASQRVVQALMERLTREEDISEPPDALGFCRVGWHPFFTDQKEMRCRP